MDGQKAKRISPCFGEMPAGTEVIRVGRFFTCNDLFVEAAFRGEFDRMRAQFTGYRAGPVELIGREKDKSTGKPRPIGIAKDYDGFRVSWTARSGVSIRYSFSETVAIMIGGSRIDFQNPGDEPNTKDEKRQRLAQFMRDVIEAVKIDSGIEEFMDRNWAAMVFSRDIRKALR